MLSFPTSTVFERRIPKQKFYQNLDVTAEVKRLFIEQIKLITWANKLSAQTMNLAPGQTVQEIEVFRIRMAGDVLDSRVLNLMDKQIPYHLLFVLERSDGKCRAFGDLQGSQPERRQCLPAAAELPHRLADAGGVDAELDRPEYGRAV